MDKFYFEKPTLKRREDAYNYIQEFKDYNSEVVGASGLERYTHEYNDYEGWLKKLEDDKKIVPCQLAVPNITYFLIRESDNKIIGMSNIRLVLNESLKNIGGHIGYSIRPIERNKGYNKINLYLGLKTCKELGIDKVLMSSKKANIASWKTMEGLGGVLVREFYEDFFYYEFIKNYEIDVNKSLEDYKEYEEYILDNK